MTKNEVLVHLDYNESYECKQQREIQIVYFGHNRFILSIVCCYLCEAKNRMICESATVSSELPDLSKEAGITSVLTVIDHFREKHQHGPLNK